MFFKISSLTLLIISFLGPISAATERRSVRDHAEQFEKSNIYKKGHQDDREDLGTTISKKEIHGLVHRFGPVVYFHPKEKYFPDSVNHFADRAYIECFTEEKKGGKVKRTSIQKYTEDIKENLASLPNHGRGCVLALTKDAIKSKGFYGIKPQSDGAIVAPAYVHVFELRPNYYIFQFIYFYAYNGPTVGVGKATLGTHEGDWEHMDVHVEKRSGDWKIARVHYAAHQQFRGGMYTPGSYPEENGHPVAYAAKYGHASLPRETLLDENLDTTKKGKYRWDCSQNYKIFAVNGVPLESEAWWANFLGRWGKTREGLNNLTSNSPEGPLDARWFRRKGASENTAFKVYNLIDDPEIAHGLRMKNAPKKGTRPFIFESPSRLNHNFCVEFFVEGGEEGEGQEGALLPWSAEVPPFKIKQKQRLGLQNKTLYRSEDAFEINKSKKYGKNFKYCFKRPKKTQLKKVSIVWKDKPAPVPLIVKLTGFEF
jgi:hypothetical protein